MTFETIVVILVVVGLLTVNYAINQVEHHAKKAADSLIGIEVTLEQVSNQLGGLEDELSRLRRHVVPMAMPFDDDPPN